MQGHGVRLQRDHSVSQASRLHESLRVSPDDMSKESFGDTDFAFLFDPEFGGVQESDVVDRAFEVAEQLL